MAGQMTPAVSIGVGLAMAATVYQLYQNGLPTVADIRSLDAHNRDVDSAEKATTWVAAGLVTGVALVARDKTAFVIGGTAVVLIAWMHRHANMVDPTTGKMTPASRPAADMTPRVTQAENPAGYTAPVAEYSAVI